MVTTAAQSDWHVPERLHVVSSFSMRTLLLEDVWRLAPGTPVNIFSRLSGGPTRNPRFDEQWVKAHVTTQQGLPNLKGPGKAVFFRQVQGYVFANPRQHDILGRPITDLVDIVTNTFQREGIVIRCPAGHTGKDFDLLLTFHEIFFYPMCVFLQADLPYSLQWRSAIQVQGGNDLPKLLLHRYIQEAGVDRTLLADALLQWRTLESKATALSSQAAIQGLQVEVERLRALRPVSGPTLLSDSVKAVCERIDSFLDEICFQCFGNFTNIHERILTLADMRSLITMVKVSVPGIWSHYMHFLGYTARLRRDKRNERRLPQYEKNVFWRFFLDCRQSNSKLLVKLALIMSAAAFVRGDGSLSSQTMVFFGISASNRTLRKQLCAWSKGIEARMTASLAKLNFVFAVFDNLQQGQSLRYHFGGSSNFFTKVTALFYLAPFLFILPEGHEAFDCEPELTYLYQAIPSPYGLPAFETMPFLAAAGSGEASNIPPDSMYGPSHSIDSVGELFRVVSVEGCGALPIDTSVDPFNPSGYRTKAYIVAVELATKLTEQQRLFSTKRSPNDIEDYCFQPEAFASSDVRKAVTAKLNSLRGDADLYRNASNFQQTMTVAWRGDPEPARILHGLVSVLDETTKQGASALLIQFMVQARLIQKDASTGRYKLCDNWEHQTTTPILVTQMISLSMMKTTRRYRGLRETRL
jgi:hypothetical protein